VGIVKSRAGKGWFVGKFDPAHSLKFLSPLLENIDGVNLEQIIESRLAIEPIVARYAAKNISDTGISRLQSTYQLMIDYANDDSKDEFRKSDRAFHGILAQECRHPIMSMLSSIMNGLFQSQLYVQKTGNYGPILEQHQEILDGILAKDADASEKAMVNHIVKSLEFLKNILKEEMLTK
jgi:DNA-binding FadR family transcriptional regulator